MLSTVELRALTSADAKRCDRMIPSLPCHFGHEGGVVDGYNRTRAFYRALGFIAAREYPTLWPDSPAMLFVLPLAPDP